MDVFIRTIQVGPAIQCFLNHGDYFGPRFPDEIINPEHYYLELLMDKCPHARNGLMLKLTGTLLFLIYIKNNSLSEKGRIIPDGIMKHCFGEEIPAQYYIDPHMNKILMTTAVEEGVNPLNTFDMINVNFSNDFNRDRFKPYYIQHIISLNSDFVEVSPHILEELQQEYNIIKTALDQWNNLSRQRSHFTSQQEGLLDDYMSPQDIKEPEDIYH
jgi:hypothetical protein